MSSLLSVLINKEPSSAAINLYLADPKTVGKVLNGFDRGCTAFIETIADLDNAHFMTKFEMQDLTARLTGMHFQAPPRDRLVAAKALAEALSQKQKDLPPAAKVLEFPSMPSRVCAPQSTVVPCKRGTKLAILVELLQRGTTLAEMVEKIGQKEGGVLSSLNWDLNKRKGYGYKVTTKDKIEIYSLLLPANFEGPLVI